MSEGLPTVLIEGLAAGANIVSTNCPSGPDEILDGGRLGALVPVNDSGALAQALIQAISKPRPPASAAEYQRYLITHASLQYAKVMFPGEF
jgi:glycosyltransferase involved in cell wall biosynthesis